LNSFLAQSAGEFWLAQGGQIPVCSSTWQRTVC